MPESEKSAEYIKGYEQGVIDFAERLKKYYKALPGMTPGSLAAYHIDVIAKELTEKELTM